MTLPQNVASDPLEKTLAAGIGSIEFVRRKVKFDESTAATHKIFTVTGLVYAEFVCFVTEAFTSGATPNISMGVQGNLAGILAQRAAAQLVINTFWVPGGVSGVHVAADSTIAKVWINNRDISITTGPGTLTAGELDVYVRYQVLSQGAQIQAA